MSRYRDQVASAVSALTILSPTRYAWLGRTSQRLSAAIDAEMDDQARRRYLVSCLAQELYWSFYSQGRPVPARWGEPEPAAPDPWLVDALSAANRGQGSWEDGWTIEELVGAEALVTGGRLRARLPVDECRAKSGALGRGADVSVSVPKDLPALWPGYYTVISDAPEAADAQSLVRVYWNVTRRGAPALVEALSGMLNAQGVGFRLKVADHPLRLQRCDAAVLYLDGGAFPALRPTLTDVAESLRSRLEPGIPVFTLQLRPGVGLAEGRTDGESFGITRCEMLADGIARARAHALTSTDERVDEVARRFDEAGVSIDAPYLEPGLDGRHVL